MSLEFDPIPGLSSEEQSRAEAEALAPVYELIRGIARRIRTEDDAKHNDWSWLSPEERP
jgi:hypothetical protein